MRLLFAAADALLTLASLEGAYSIRTHLHAGKLFRLPFETNLGLAIFCALAWALIGWQQQVSTSLAGTPPHRVFRDTLRQCIFGGVLLVLFQYILHLNYELSRGFLLIFCLCNFVVLMFFHLLAPSILGAWSREFGRPYHLVLVGTPDRIAHLRRELSAASFFRSNIVAVLAPERAGAALPNLLASHVVDEVIFDVDWSTLGALAPVLHDCDEEGVRTRIAMEFFPHVNSQLSLDRMGDIPLLTFFADPLEDLRLLIKRAIDILLSSVALVVLFPFFVILGILIRYTSHGPIIYRQQRCGLNGRLFWLYKFRSMVQNADELKESLAHLNEREVVFKMKHDPRVTPIGKIIRKLSIDELPQLYNVLRGDMSLVGPRPPIPEEVAKYERWQRRRLRMRPGLTCLWAILGRDQLDFNSWMRADLFYIDNWCLALDWLIMFRTIPLVLRGRNAH